MSEEANLPALNSPEDEPVASRQEEKLAPDVKEAESERPNGTISNGDAALELNDVATDAPREIDATNSTIKTNAEQTTSDDVTKDKAVAAQEDIEMADDTKADDAADGSAEPTTGTPASASKPQARRKSGGVPEHKGRKLNKKASKPKMLHTDAKSGDYFYVRIKGYPLWPGIVCAEDMLPPTLLKNRPAGAAMADGTYRPGYEDGGPKVKDRSFPVMYLQSNDFGWVSNHDLVELNFDEVGEVPANMRKDLASARRLAAEKNDLDYFREILRNFEEQKEADRLAKEAIKAEKKAKKAAAKKEKKSAALVGDEEDAEAEDDIDMLDAIGVTELPSKTNTNGKRANEDAAAQPEPKRPKIKLNTPKTTNGTSTPKATKDPAVPKSTTKKPKKSKAAAAETPEVVAPKEPELSPEEKRVKKEKEILFLRHKLQKGLLTRDQEPKEEEMKQMSEFVTKLEGYADLEVSIIRTTKINKVLKAILKLSAIPKEEEFQFKPRSQSLLDKWNKLLASEQGTPVAPGTNGTAAEPKAEEEETKASPADPTNGTKESSADVKADEKEETSAPETKEDAEGVEDGPAEDEDKTMKESAEEPTTVESTA